MLLLAIALLAAAPSAQEQARSVLKRVGCQKCHDSKVSIANTDALFVYDLQNDKWAQGLDDKQLGQLLVRSANASKEDLKIVRSFVDAEIKARHP